MSGRAGIEQRFQRLREISGIMTAMKSLSLVETRKLARFIGHQQRMLATIEAAASDFLHFFQAQGASETESAILLLVGSERGFCGSFNGRILAALQELPPSEPVPRLLVVGGRLRGKLESHPDVLATLDGPTVTEDVPAVLDRLMDALHAAHQQLAGDGIALHALAHDAEGEPRLKRLLPLSPPKGPRFGHPPRLQLRPAEFFAQMLDHYLLAALYGVLYDSLAAENRRRLEHMEHALNRLDETVARLAVKRNALRQEEIVEEIEIIMLSAEALQTSPGTDERC